MPRKAPKPKLTFRDWAVIIPMITGAVTFGIHWYTESKNEDARDMETARRRGIDSLVRAQRYEELNRKYDEAIKYTKALNHRMKKLEKKFHIEPDDDE